MKSFLAAAFLLAVSTGAALAEPGTVAVQDMKRVEVSGNFVVTVAPGPAGARVEAADGLRSRVGVEVRPDGIRVWDKCVVFCNRRQPIATIAVTSPDLQSIDVSKGVEARVTGLSASAVEARASMGSELVLDGRCDALTVSARMGAQVDAVRLECASATVHAAMGADVSVFATQRLDADASMGADIEVRGQPAAFDARGSMGGSVQRKSVD